MMAGLGVQAQELPPNNKVAFEVASITRRNDRVPVGRRRQTPDGSLTLLNVTTADLIAMAYSPLEYDDMLGLPEWASTERYDVITKAPALPSGPTTEQRIAMIRALLSERYQMIVHTESRELPAFDLVLDRSDGTLGPRLIPANIECDPPTFEAIPDELSRRPRCLLRMEGNRFEGDMTLTSFAGFLRNLVGRMGRDEKTIVVDKTGLTGLYHITFESSTQPFTGRLISGLPSLATALREQLGLRLENKNSRGMVKVLVIDQLKRPTEN